MTDMKITYIHHSSFMAELDHAVLLFDYFEGNIQMCIRDRRITVRLMYRQLRTELWWCATT